MIIDRGSKYVSVAEEEKLQTNISRRNFGKAMAATTLGGLAAGYSSLARGGMTPVNSLLIPSPVTELEGGPDSVLAQIADYVERFEIKSEQAYSTAHLVVLDSLACGFYALSYPACTKMLG